MNSRPPSPNTVDPTVFPSTDSIQLITNKYPRISPLNLKPGRDLPLTKRWLTIYQLQQHFWEMFQIEYLQNPKYFRPSDAVRYTENIYASIIPAKVPPRLKSVFNEDIEQQKLNWGVETLDVSREIVFRVGEGDWTVVVSPNWAQTTIICDKNETRLQSTISLKKARQG